MAQPVIGLVAPQIPAPLWILARRSTFNEPGVLVRGVIRHEIEDHSKTTEMNLCQQAVEILHRSKDRIDAAIIRHIVAKIGHRRRVDRRDPDGVNPKSHKVIKTPKNPIQIADPIAVTVLKRARINLVDNAVLPPGGLLHLNKCSCSSNFPLKVSSYDQRSLVQERHHLLPLCCYLYGCKRRRRRRLPGPAAPPRLSQWNGNHGALADAVSAVSMQRCRLRYRRLLRRGSTIRNFRGLRRSYTWMQAARD